MDTKAAISFSRSTRGPSLAACWVLIFCALACAHALPALALTTGHFVAAGVGVYDGTGNEVTPEVLQTSATGPLVVETGSLPTAYGKFRSAFGSNGFDIQTTGGIDREVDGGSIWSDGFTATGDAGSGSLALSVHLQGNVSGHAEMGYALFVSPQPFDLGAIIATVSAAEDLWAVQLPDSTLVLFTGVANRCGQAGASYACGHVPYENHQGPLDLTLTASVPFTNGQTIYVASLFAGGVGVFGGNESFFNSADFGISAPADTTLEALSGSVYAAAIPEPSTALLLVVGTVLGALRGRFKRAGSAIKSSRAAIAFFPAGPVGLTR